MARYSRRIVLCLGIVFHLVQLGSIFDIYFVTPLVHGMKQFRPQVPAPAKRVFLVVGDGLRADKLFQKHNDPDTGEYRHLAPYLRSIVLEQGTFGISHTRVPTESRPGHVAIIAGFYEDVSAVTKGWKMNPVNFDSVFNQSRHTWAFGSPDILPMFAHGASDPNRVQTFMYAPDAEDYTADATALDTWVFEHVESLFRNASSSRSLDATLRQERTVFFLHLLGLDTTGHAYRPYSKEYLRNIKVVDEGVKATVKLVNDFFKDDATAWVFTADHGMSDWGSHGDGHPDNTRTPLIAWGAGINKPDKRNPTGHDDFSSDWYLDSVKRLDVNQADIAPLMSYLVGLNFPVNSVGELPLDYISCGLEEKGKIAFANALEIAEQYSVKERTLSSCLKLMIDSKMATEIVFRPFKPLRSEGNHLEDRIESIRNMIEQKKYKEAIDASTALMKITLEGFRYLQTYDWLFLRSLVTAGFLGWTLFVLVHIFDSYVLSRRLAPRRGRVQIILSAVIALTLTGVMYIQHSPLIYYAYAGFPIFFWEEVIASREIIGAGLHVLMQNGGKPISPATVISQLILYICVLESLVYGYFHRHVFSICFIFASMWPYTYGSKFWKSNRILVGGWTLCCIIMSSFTLLPVVKQESLLQIHTSGIIMVGIGIWYLGFGKRWIAWYRGGEDCLASKDSTNHIITGIQIGLIALSVVLTQITATALQNKKGLALGNQLVGWSVLVVSLTIPFLHFRSHGHHYLHRLAIMFLAFAPTFIILTISYEGLFYVAFFVTLVLWSELETKVANLIEAQPSLANGMNGHAITSKPSFRKLTLSDVRIALFFFVLLQTGFFGTGNIASVSSFSLESVYRLVPLFDPFLMGALLIFKILVPFAVISATLGILNRKLHVPPSSLFMIVLTISDILTLNFFYLVRDEGSWLDIGTSISHFCISNLLILFVIALEQLSELIISGAVVSQVTHESKWE